MPTELPAGVADELPCTRDGILFSRCDDGAVLGLRTEQEASEQEEELFLRACRGKAWNGAYCVILAQGKGLSGFTDMLSELLGADGVDFCPLPSDRLAVRVSAENELGGFAEALAATVTGEMGTDIAVGISTAFCQPRNLAEAFRQAQAAAATGFLLNKKAGVWKFSDILPELILLQLNKTELLALTGKLESACGCLDRETLHMAKEMFRQNLNVSETARRCYLHRNTLLYRLDKLEKDTGLNLRTFDDAVALRLLAAVREIDR